MANAETRRDEYTFLGKGCTIRTYLLWAATQLPVYFSEIWARAGSRVTTKRRAFERLGKSSKAQRAHFCAPKFGTSLWRDGHTHGRTDRQIEKCLPRPKPIERQWSRPSSRRHHCTRPPRFARRLRLVDRRPHRTYAAAPPPNAHARAAQRRTPADTADEETAAAGRAARTRYYNAGG